MSSKSKKPKPQIVKDAPQLPAADRLDITEGQLRLLVQADADVRQATERFNLVFTAIVNGHGIENAKLADAGVDESGPYLKIQTA